MPPAAPPIPADGKTDAPVQDPPVALGLLGRALTAVGALAAAWVIGDVLRTFLARRAHPFDLEWMEGGVLAHAWRVAHGLPIYTEPGPDWIPMIYPPGYATLLAALSPVFGLGPALGRTVSALGTLAAAAALPWAASRLRGQAWAGWVGAATFLGCYPHGGAFFDLVRPDGLAMGALAWATVLALDPDPRRQRGAGLLLAVAFALKHHAAAFGPALAVGALAAHGGRLGLREGLRAGLRVGLWALVPAGLLTAWMQLVTEGRFTVWLLDVPQSHPVVWDRAWPGAPRELAAALAVPVGALGLWGVGLAGRFAPAVPPPVLAVGALGAAAAVHSVMGPLPAVRGVPQPSAWEAVAGHIFLGAGAAGLLVAVAGWLGQRWRAAPPGPFSRGLVSGGALVHGALFLATALGVAALMRGHHGGFMNVLIPAHWAIALAFTGLLADLRGRLPGGAGGLLAGSLALAHLVPVALDSQHDRLIPGAEDVEAGQRVVDALRGREGPVLAPFSPWLPTYAGHAPSWHLIALWDIRHREGPYQPRVEALLRAAREGHWGTVLLADAEGDGEGLGVRRHYDHAQSFTFRGRTLQPRTGWHRRPASVWVRPEAGRPRAADANADAEKTPGEGGPPDLPSDPKEGPSDAGATPTPGSPGTQASPPRRPSPIRPPPSR